MAQAMRAQQLATKSSILPVTPNSDKDIILMYSGLKNLTILLTTKQEVVKSTLPFGGISREKRQLPL